MPLSWKDWSSIVGAVGGLCGIYALYQNSQQTRLATEQTQLMKDQAKKADELEREERQWAEGHEALGARLSHLGPHALIEHPVNHSQFGLYTAVFPDPQFRSKLETYNLESNASRTEFRPRKAAPHELSLQGLRETVVAAEQLIEKYDRENPKVQLMYYLGVAKRT